MRVRVVVERALRRPFLGPDLERGQLLERGQVVAGARVHHLLDRRGLREVDEQALGRRLVLAEVPDAPEVGQERRVAPLRTGRHAVGPQLLGDLRRVALGDRPGARRVHDQRALAGDQILVVGGVVPGRRVRRQPLRQLLVVFERLAHRIRLDGDAALGVHQVGAEGLEDRAGGVDVVLGHAEPDAEREAGLVAGLGRLEHGVQGPGVGLRRRSPPDTSPARRCRHASSGGRCASTAP